MAYFVVPDSTNDTKVVALTFWGCPLPFFHSLLFVSCLYLSHCHSVQLVPVRYSLQSYLPLSLALLAQDFKISRKILL